MNSNVNNDILRQALQRRAERMAPAKGWEDRVLAEMATPRRRFRLKWLSIPAAAAVIAFVVTLYMPSNRTTTIEPTITFHITIAQAPAPLIIEKEIKPDHKPEKAERPTPVQTEIENSENLAAEMMAKFDAQRIEVDDELSVLEEIEVLLCAYQ